jgi:PAS domain S-box-containing protein
LYPARDSFTFHDPRDSPSPPERSPRAFFLPPAMFPPPECVTRMTTQDSASAAGIHLPNLAIAPAAAPAVGLDGALAEALFAQSPLSTVIYDPEGRLLAVNPAFERLWGVTLGTAPPDYCVLTDPELEGQGVLPFIRRAFQGETVTTPPVRYDISRLSTDGGGRVRWTQAYLYPVRDAAGALTHVVLTHLDLTEQKEGEVALRQREERLRLAQRAAHIGTFDWDVPSGRVAWTDEEERLFGIEPGTFAGTIEAWGTFVLPAFPACRPTWRRRWNGGSGTWTSPSASGGRTARCAASRGAPSSFTMTTARRCAWWA